MPLTLLETSSAAILSAGKEKVYHLVRKWMRIHFCKGHLNVAILLSNFELAPKLSQNLCQPFAREVLLELPKVRVLFHVAH